MTESLSQRILTTTLGNAELAEAITHSDFVHDMSDVLTKHTLDVYMVLFEVGDEANRKGRLEQAHMDKLNQNIIELEVITNHYKGLYTNHKAECGCGDREFTDLFYPHQAQKHINIFKQHLEGFKKYQR